MQNLRGDESSACNHTKNPKGTPVLIPRCEVGEWRTRLGFSSRQVNPVPASQFCSAHTTCRFNSDTRCPAKTVARSAAYIPEKTLSKLNLTTDVFGMGFKTRLPGENFSGEGYYNQGPRFLRTSNMSEPRRINTQQQRWMFVW